MKINKEQLKTIWYEDNEGNVIPHKESDPSAPKEAKIFRTVGLLEVTDNFYKIIRQKDVDKCKHPRKYRRMDYGLIKGMKGRICDLCGGRQTRKKNQLWGRKWEGSGTKKIFSGTTTLSDLSIKTAIKMSDSGDYTLREAILIMAKSCERCGKVLINKYFGKEFGYPEYSLEWFKCNTRCKFCEDDTTEPSEEIKQELEEIEKEREARRKRKEARNKMRGNYNGR